MCNITHLENIETLIRLVTYYCALWFGNFNAWKMRKNIRVCICTSFLDNFVNITLSTTHACSKTILNNRKHWSNIRWTISLFDFLLCFIGVLAYSVKVQKLDWRDSVQSWVQSAPTTVFESTRIRVLDRIIITCSIYVLISKLI